MNRKNFLRSVAVFSASVYIAKDLIFSVEKDIIKHTVAQVYTPSRFMLGRAIGICRSVNNKEVSLHIIFSEDNVTFVNSNNTWKKNVTKDGPITDEELVKYCI